MFDPDTRRRALLADSGDLSVEPLSEINSKSVKVCALMLSSASRR